MNNILKDAIAKAVATIINEKYADLDYIPFSIAQEVKLLLDLPTANGVKEWLISEYGERTTIYIKRRPVAVHLKKEEDNV